MAIAISCPSCQSRFSLKDDFAGKQVRCPRCQNVLVVPEEEIDLSQFPVAAGSGEESAATGGIHPHFLHDIFFIKQQVLRVNENYDIMNENKEKLFYATRPTFILATCGVLILGGFIFVACLLAFSFLADLMFGKDGTVIGVLIGMVVGFFGLLGIAVWLYPKRHISVYVDESKAQLLLEIKQDKKLELVNATFTIIDPQVGIIGHLKKNYLMNLIRRQWQILDANGELIAHAKEDSIILSLLRRMLGHMFGLLRTNFIFEFPDSEKIFGEYNRKFTLTDQYVMDLKKDRKRRFDRRIAIGMAIMLDTGERR
jgi:predicted Zn finger-like uncharacterized protein